MGSTARREQRAVLSVPLLWPGCLVSPLFPAPTGLVDLCYIPTACEDKGTVTVSNAMKIRNNKELCIQPSPQSTPQTLLRFTLANVSHIH